MQRGAQLNSSYHLLVSVWLDAGVLRLLFLFDDHGVQSPTGCFYRVEQQKYAAVGPVPPEPHQPYGYHAGCVCIYGS